MTIEFIDNKSKFFTDVKTLGRKYSATLGFMPDGGFDDYAKNKCIIVAHDGRGLAGYLMFRVAFRLSRISLVLCICVLVIIIEVKMFPQHYLKH